MARSGDVVVVVTGANELADVGKRLRKAGEQGKGLRTALLQSIRREAKPLIDDVKQSAMDVIPARGGLARKVRTGVRSQIRTSGKTPGVRIIARNKYAIQQMDRGRIRHPVFGNRETWVTQQIKPGWFTKPLQKGSKRVAKNIRVVIAETAIRLER